MDYIRSHFASSGSYRANVLAHLSWISWVVFPAGFWGLIKAEDWITKAFCMLILTVLLIYNIMKYEYWAKNDPDRLQTERFILEKRRLDIFASKGEAPHLLEPGDIDIPPKMLSGHESEKPL